MSLRPGEVADVGSAPARGRPWLRRAIVVAVVMYWVAIFTLTHIPAKDVPTVGVSDKLAHFVMYALLGTGLGVVLRSRPALWALVIVAVGLAYGAIDEWTQPLVGRSCELMDWVADGAGVAVAGVIFLLMRWWARRSGN